MNNLATFNNVLFTSVPGLTVLATNPYLPPKRKLSIDSLARSDKSKLSSAFYTGRQIAVRVGISRTSRALVEQSLDALMALLQAYEKELVLSQAGSVRKYFCTLADVVAVKSGGSYLELNLIFECSDSFGYDTGYSTALSLSGVTSSTRADAIPFTGSAPWQVPVITIYYTAMSGGTDGTVIVGNSATGQQVTVVRDWGAGDRLEIDSANKTVKVNGSIVAFSGAIPEWAPTLGNWGYSDSFTTRTFNATITYYARNI